MSDTPMTIVRALYAAIEAGLHGDELRPLFTDDCQTLEQPNLIKPRGALSTLGEMVAASRAGAGLLTRQRYEVRSALELADGVIVRLTWRGTLARDVGALRAGQQLTAHIAQFIDTRDGRVARVETYDCYEPFET